MPVKPLKLISSMATRDVVAEIVVRYGNVAARPVTAEAAGGVDVAKRIMGGEPIDVVILANNAIDKLVSEKKLIPGSRVDLVRSGIAIAVKAGARKPDIASEQAVRNAVMRAPTLSYSTGPSGVYLEKMFERWGILGEIRDRIVVPPPGVPVGSIVASGTAALGFQQLSELLNCPGIEVVGALPPAIQSITVFSGGIATGCEDLVSARALLAYMASPAVADVKRRHGMEAA
jgi:molybdate transport system substrate-binding protein